MVGTRSQDYSHINVDGDCQEKTKVHLDLCLAEIKGNESSLVLQLGRLFAKVNARKRCILHFRRTYLPNISYSHVVFAG